MKQKKEGMTPKNNSGRRKVTPFLKKVTPFFSRCYLKCYLENGVRTPKNGKSNTVTPVTPFFLAIIGKKICARANVTSATSCAYFFFSYARNIILGVTSVTF